MLARGLGAEVDAVEHERRAARAIAAPITSPWTMSPARSECSTRSWTSVSIRARPGVAEDLDRLGGQVGAGDHAGAQGVVDVVVDVGDAVDQPDDLALERGGLLARGRSG